MFNAGTLYATHHRMLAAVVRRWHPNLFDVEDILQNIFLKLHQKIQLFRGQSKIESWLYRIAVNESIDFYRKHRHAIEDSEPLDPAVEADHAPGQDHSLEQGELREKVEALTWRLEESLRKVFSRYFFEEKRVEEISRELGISANAVRCRIYKSKCQVLAEAKKSGLISEF